MLTLVHEVPGRLRFVAPELTADSEHVASLTRTVRELPGVTDVLVRPATGSLIVFHDGAPAAREAVLRAVGLTRTRRHVLDRRVPLLDTLVEAAAEKLLTHAVHALVAAIL